MNTFIQLLHRLGKKQITIFSIIVYRKTAFHHCNSINNQKRKNRGENSSFSPRFLLLRLYLIVFYFIRSSFTMHSVCIGISSLYYMAKGFVQKIPDFRQRVAFYRFTPFCSISPLFRAPTIPILIGKTSVYFVSPESISLIHLGTVGTFFPERSIFTISSVSSFLQNLSRI